VELIGWNRETLREYYTPKRVRELRAFVEDAGLKISEFVSTPEGMASPDEKERAGHGALRAGGRGDGGLRHRDRELSVRLSVRPRVPRITDRPHLQQWTVDIPSGLDWKRNWEECVDVMRRCVSVCEDAGVRYALGRTRTATCPTPPLCSG
jgi:sugar phosphate isomerase/epimerase